MGDAFGRETGHLSAQHGAFLAHWHRLLDLEEGGLLERRSQIWRLHGAPLGPRVLLCTAHPRA